MYQCKLCLEEFEKHTQLAHHVAYVHGTAQKKLEDQKLERIRKYREHPTLCQHCSVELPYDQRKNKFCSMTCAALHNNPRRVSETAKYGVCLTCGKEFTKKSWQNKKFCTQYCATQYRSIQLKQSWLETGITGDWTGGKTGGAPKAQYVIQTLKKEQNNECAICHRPSTWEEKPLVLILDHIDGDSTNNSRSNLRLICPNCNSQTDTFSGRNKGRGRKSLGFYKELNGVD